MSDIVKRMREREKFLTAISPYDLLLEASDVIVRLRYELAKARNKALEEAAEILDAAGEILVDEWTSDLGGTDQTRAAGIASHRISDAAAAIRLLKAEGESRE